MCLQGLLLLSCCRAELLAFECLGNGQHLAVPYFADDDKINEIHRPRHRLMECRINSQGVLVLRSAANLHLYQPFIQSPSHVGQHSQMPGLCEPGICDMPRVTPEVHAQAVSQLIDCCQVCYMKYVRQLHIRGTMLRTVIRLGSYDVAATEARIRSQPNPPPLSPEDLLTDDQDPGTPYLRQVQGQSLHHVKCCRCILVHPSMRPSLGKCWPRDRGLLQTSLQ